jgi:IclR family pca regulon transcriptional regulator
MILSFESNAVTKMSINTANPNINPLNSGLPKKVHAASGMSSLVKGLSVIEAFYEQGTKMTIAEVARATGMNRATARRCLHTLAECGYLRFGGKLFEPTPRMLRLGSSYNKVATLPRIAQPFLDATRDLLDESVSLTVLQDGCSAFIARAEANNIINIGLALGTCIPAYSCATGRVLLSAYPVDALGEYLERCEPIARTPNTMIDCSAIRRSIEAVRSQNYSITDEELELGMRSIAIPIRTADGEIVAAISASTLTMRKTVEEMVSEFYPILSQTAEKLGQAL